MRTAGEITESTKTASTKSNCLATELRSALQDAGAVLISVKKHHRFILFSFLLEQWMSEISI